MEKIYLTLEEVQDLFAKRMEEYRSRITANEDVLTKVTEHLYQLIVFKQEGKVKVYQQEIEGGKHTFIEFTDSETSGEEKELLKITSGFLMKVESDLGYRFL